MWGVEKVEIRPPHPTDYRSSNPLPGPGAILLIPDTVQRKVRRLLVVLLGREAALRIWPRVPHTQSCTGMQVSKLQQEEEGSAPFPH